MASALPRLRTRLLGYLLLVLNHEGHGRVLLSIVVESYTAVL